MSSLLLEPPLAAAPPPPFRSSLLVPYSLSYQRPYNINNNFRPISLIHSLSNPNTSSTTGHGIINTTNITLEQEQDHEEEEDQTKKDRRKVVRIAWEKLVRWSRSWRSKAKTDVLERTNKVYLSSISS